MSKLDGPLFGPFDCGRSEQNEFLYEWAWKDQMERLSTTYVMDVGGMMAGFVTVCMDALPLSRSERGPDIRYRYVSALKLAQLGVDRRFQGTGLGREAVRLTLGLAERVGEQVGCRYVTFDAHPDLENWYASLGFLRNRIRHEERVADAKLHQRDPDSIPVSMRYDLRSTA
ncbi:MAG TPA: GNAT family N-acetyltransferase [Longimicrobium sp.]|nr:GNAT family N-acetyltransferase [Longimicrobium sp.]